MLSPYCLFRAVFHCSFVFQLRFSPTNQYLLFSEKTKISVAGNTGTKLQVHEEHWWRGLCSRRWGEMRVWWGWLLIVQHKFLTARKWLLADWRAVAAGSKTADRCRIYCTNSLICGLAVILDRLKYFLGEMVTIWDRFWQRYYVVSWLDLLTIFSKMGATFGKSPSRSITERSCYRRRTYIVVRCA